MRPGCVILTALCAAGSPVVAHDWYEGLTSPSGTRCCDRRDCVPVGHRYDPAGRRLEVELEGRWVPVAPAAVVPLASPDGDAHACYEHLSVFGVEILSGRCVVLPGES